MRPSRPLPEGSEETLHKALRESKSKLEFQRIQCVWLRSCLGLNSEQIALGLGLQAPSVRRLQSLFFNGGITALKGFGRGGRHRENLSKEEEELFLKKFFTQAQEGGIIEVSEVKRAYEKKVGRRVPKSTVYRMLARHGWRKIVPRPRHPKTDEAEQSAFKKTL